MIRFKFFLILFLLPLISQAQEIDELAELLSRKDYQGALQLIESIESVDSLSFTTLNLIGQMYEDLTRYDEALKFYQRAFCEDSTQISLLYSLSRVSLNLGNGGLGQKYLNSILDRDSINFYANYQLGGLNYSLGNYREALGYYRKLYEAGNETPAIKRKMGDCYYQLSIYEGAALMYLGAFNQNRNNALLASSLINLLYRMGEENYDDAVAICDTALTYTPDNKILLRDRGMGAYLKKEYAVADSLFSRLLEKGDSSLFNLKYAGLSRFMNQLYMQTIPVMEKAYELNPKDVEVVLTLASVYGLTYEPDLGLQLLDSADVLLYPSVSQRFGIAKTRGDIYTRKAQFSQASKYLIKAYQLYPKRYDVLRALAYVQSNLVGLSSTSKCNFEACTEMYSAAPFPSKEGRPQMTKLNR